MVSQMIVGRIRTIDIVSRLHGDEFALFISEISDFALAHRIVEDINESLKIESREMELPEISVSAGAALVYSSETYENILKLADDALYRAKATHNGSFST